MGILIKTFLVDQLCNDFYKGEKMVRDYASEFKKAFVGMWGCVIVHDSVSLLYLLYLMR